MTAPLLTSVREPAPEIRNTAEALPALMEDCWDEPASPIAGPTTYEELQGAWFSATGRREAELLISGNRFTVRFADGDIYMGAFDLNAEWLPKRMDMRIEEGPIRHKGKTALCIYELDGRTLRWCAVSPGQAERLAAFPAEDHPEYLSLVFRREQPV